MPTSSSRVKSVFLHGFLPAVAGLWCAHLLPGLSPASTPEGERTTLPHQANHLNPQSKLVQLASRTEAPVEKSEKKPGKTKEWLELLGDNYRVEDLRIEVEKLPPGPDRNFGVWRLMKEWLPLDRSAAMDWMGHLADASEKDAAVRGLLESWSKEDTHAASAYVAALPEGPLKCSAGKVLSDSLSLRDRASALSWSLASRGPGENLKDDVRHKVSGLAGEDYETTARLVAESALSEAEKQQMKEIARAAWNLQRVRKGKWGEIIPAEGATP